LQQQLRFFYALIFFRVPASTVKAGSGYTPLLYGLKKRHEGCRFIPHAHKVLSLLAKRSNHTSTETKAEQLDGILSPRSAYCSRNDNERLLYYWSKPLQQYLIHQNQWIIIIFLHSSYADKN
jgi:hypothetical protein